MSSMPPATGVRPLLGNRVANFDLEGIGRPNLGLSRLGAGQDFKAWIEVDHGGSERFHDPRRACRLAVPSAIRASSVFKPI